MDAAPVGDVITWQVDLYYIAIYPTGAVPLKTLMQSSVVLQTHGSLYNVGGRSSNASLSKEHDVASVKRMVMRGDRAEQIEQNNEHRIVRIPRASGT
jgi:hypothetical protein